MSATFFGILSGGAGTRLWPISRKSYPKQFYALASKEPLLVETLKRVDGLGELQVLTTSQLQHATLGLINRYGLNAQVLPEPAPQNTAPIISAFAELCFRKDPDSVAVVLPADHSIHPLSAFRKDLAEAIEIASRGHIVTIGIPPQSESTAYGYLEIAQSSEKFPEKLSVKKFTEKPDLPNAQRLIREGALWNSGIFIFSTRSFRKLLEQHAPEIYKVIITLKDDLSNFDSVYKALPSISIDYALMEKLSEIQCVKASFTWSDLGSWEEVSTHSIEKHAVYEVDGKNNFYSSTQADTKSVAFVGVSNLIAVETPDALLVLEKGHGQDVKKLVDLIKVTNSKVTNEHSFEERPWGRFEILLDTPTYKSKLITVWPGQRLSYQSHKKRAENWIVVEGEGDFTLNDETQRVSKGQHLFIPLGAKHRISNPGKDVLKFVEVQLGSYFGEDDIVRYDDDYGRK